MGFGSKTRLHITQGLQTLAVRYFAHPAVIGHHTQSVGALWHGHLVTRLQQRVFARVGR